MHLQSTIHPSLFVRTCLRFRQVIRGLPILAAILMPAIGLAQTEPAPAKKKEGAMVRFLCVQTLSGEEEEVGLATKTESGDWTERGTVALRSPLVSPWLPLPVGTIHLTRKDQDKTISIGSFPISQDSTRTIIVLFPDKANNLYRTQVIDPGKLGFQKGKALVINYGTVPAIVNIGKLALTVNPGQQVVERIDANEDGMYRLLVGHFDKDKKIVPCYDRFVSSNPKTRKFILLFPDQNTGLRAMSLSEFGPFE